jgi:hypothetical protein
MNVQKEGLSYFDSPYSKPLYTKSFVLAIVTVE